MTAGSWLVRLRDVIQTLQGIADDEAAPAPVREVCRRAVSALERGAAVYRG